MLFDLALDAVEILADAPVRGGLVARHHRAVVPDIEREKRRQTPLDAATAQAHADRAGLGKAGHWCAWRSCLGVVGHHDRAPHVPTLPKHQPPSDSRPALRGARRELLSLVLPDRGKVREDGRPAPQ